MNFKNLLNYLEKNSTTENILSDDQIIESITEIYEAGELKNDSVYRESLCQKEAIEAAMILNIFLLRYDKLRQKFLLC